MKNDPKVIEAYLGKEEVDLMAALMLELSRNLRAGYGVIEALKGIDHRQQGEIVAVIGANGAGKSTLDDDLRPAAKA